MIRLKEIYVSFTSGNKTVEAVRGATLDIAKGEIFGVIGTSGAGKSTLLRTINLLQRPSQGTITINGADVTHLKGEELRRLRLETGMIFQQFNLIHTKTVYDNIAFTMRAAGKPKDEIKKRVTEVLELVGLADKAGSYPAKLSGGQKQRVGIARAIANNPSVLLCDEPTSALDLETTHSILHLLKEINRRLGITTVIISHEMHVIKQICDRVAVMYQGEVVEEGDVFSVFAVPRHDFTKQLVNRSMNLELPQRILDDKSRRLLKIIYRGSKAEEALISETARAFDVNVNVLHGQIEYIADQPIGILIVSLEGEDAAKASAEAFLKSRAAEVVELNG
jgi:D-methionine transport system ATP-binding protein